MKNSIFPKGQGKDSHMQEIKLRKLQIDQKASNLLFDISLFC
jgi:hypothetical protein